MSSFTVNLTLSGSGETSCSLKVESKPVAEKEKTADPLASESLVGAASSLLDGITPAKVGEDVGSSAGSFESLMSSLDWQRLKQLVKDRPTAPSSANTDRLSAETPSCWSLPLPVPTRWFEDEVDSILQDVFVAPRD